VERLAVVEALGRLLRRRLEVRWVRPRFEDGIPRDRGETGEAIGHAVVLRASLVETAGERALRRLGVTVERLRPRRASAASMGAAVET
jgi:hypothetical protein